MKKLLILIFTICCFNVFSNDIVNIYADNDPNLMGVSKEKVWLKSYMLSNFEYYQTLSTETNKGYLTPVTVSRDLFYLLDEFLEFQDIYRKGNVIVTKEDGIYHFHDEDISLQFSFGLEKASDPIFNIIENIYKNDPKNATAVLNHYLDSWVIRIYSAENVVNPDIETLDFDDILITATIIGEKFQWLWGIHDGVDYVYQKIK